MNIAINELLQALLSLSTTICSSPFKRQRSAA